MQKEAASKGKSPLFPYGPRVLGDEWPSNLSTAVSGTNALGNEGQVMHWPITSRLQEDYGPLHLGLAPWCQPSSLFTSKSIMCQNRPIQTTQPTCDNKQKEIQYVWRARIKSMIATASVAGSINWYLKDPKSSSWGWSIFEQKQPHEWSSHGHILHMHSLHQGKEKRAKFSYPRKQILK